MNFFASDRYINLTFRRPTSDLDILKEVMSNNVYNSTLRLSEECMLLNFGAHIGTFTNFFVLTHPKSKAICIEPNPDSFALLTQNIQANRISSRVNCISAALVPQDTLQVERFVHLDFPTEQNDTFEQFHISSAGRWVAVGISLRELASLLDPDVPIVIKMDIEGGELPILTELFALLEGFSVMGLHMEFHGSRLQMDEWLAKLKSIGFHCEATGFILRAEKY